MNNGNLKKGNPDTQFRSGREAVENGRKGGIASGISRNFRSAVKKKLKENPDKIDVIVDMLLEEATEGRNLKAVEMLIDLIGDSVQRETLNLRKKELKIREAELKQAREQKETSESFEDVIVSAYEKRKNHDAE